MFPSAKNRRFFKFRYFGLATVLPNVKLLNTKNEIKLTEPNFIRKIHFLGVRGILKFGSMALILYWRGLAWTKQILIFWFLFRSRSSNSKITENKTKINMCVINKTSKSLKTPFSKLKMNNDISWNHLTVLHGIMVYNINCSLLNLEIKIKVLWKMKTVQFGAFL